MDLFERLNNHIAMMAPHQKDRLQGKLLIESRDALKELKEANDNLFRIKQKTVVENQALKGQLATAKREITTYREFAEAQIRDLTKEKEEAYEKGKRDGKIETLKDETLP